MPEAQRTFEPAPYRVVNVRDFRPWTNVLAEYVYIGRAYPGTFRESPFANWFSPHSSAKRIIAVPTVRHAVACYRHYLLGEWEAIVAVVPWLGSKRRAADRESLVRRRTKAIEALPELRAKILEGRPLGCWCVDPSGKGLCHGNVLGEIATGPEFDRLATQSTFPVIERAR